MRDHRLVEEADNPIHILYVLMALFTYLRADVRNKEQILPQEELWNLLPAAWQARLANVPSQASRRGEADQENQEREVKNAR